MQRHYTLRPSFFLAALFTSLWILLTATLWVLPLPQSFFMVGVAAASFTFLYLLMRDARLRLRHSCVAFRLEDDNKVVLVLRNGRHLSGSLQMDSVVTPYLVVLNVTLAERRGRRSLVLVPSGVRTDGFRRLCVALRWGRDSVQSAAGSQNSWNGLL